jgi:hypothetical protein
MKVQILIDFKDGYDSYSRGEVREMSEQKVRQFAGYGWVAAQGVNTGALFNGEATLAIQDGQIGQTSEY